MHALGNLEPRGVLFVDAVAEVYEGMLVGEHTRWALLVTGGTSWHCLLLLGECCLVGCAAADVYEGMLGGSTPGGYRRVLLAPLALGGGG